MSTPVFEDRTFTVVRIRKRRSARKGRYVECRLDNADWMAFWGGIGDGAHDSGNLRTLEGRPVPCTVTADRFRSLEDGDKRQYPQHSFWVPQDARLTFAS